MYDRITDEMLEAHRQGSGKCGWGFEDDREDEGQAFWDEINLQREIDGDI